MTVDTLESIEDEIASGWSTADERFTTGSRTIRIRPDIWETFRTLATQAETEAQANEDASIPWRSSEAGITWYDEKVEIGRKDQQSRVVGRHDDTRMEVASYPHTTDGI